MHDELFMNFKKLGYKVRLEEKRFLFELDIDNEIVKLSVSVPDDYPYTFLEVHLVSMEELSFEIPHMISGDYLCLYDLDNDRHDYKNYLAESEETLKRAKELLVLSKRGELSEEYQNEFYDLWTAKEFIPIYSIIHDYGKGSLLDVFKCEKINKKSTSFFLAIDTEIASDTIINIFNNLSVSNSEIIGRAIYIPVKETRLTKYIRNLSDLLNLIENEKDFDFFSKKVFNSKNQFVFLGISNTEFPTPTLVALSLPELITPKGRIIKSKSYHSILKFNAAKKIVRFGLTDLSQDRLITRGGEGIKIDKLKIYMIGCGSLGSFLSKYLCDTGKVSEMLLQDNQVLKSENIGRHLCGIEYLQEMKSLAVSRKINSNYPAIKLSTLNHSFIQELQAKKDTLASKKYDLIVCATGDENIEEEIINRLKAEKINKPVIIAWVEPFLIAGHFILINSPVNENTENYIFDADKNIGIGIVQDASLYVKSEAGCQSHFMPYSGFEMQMFSQVIVDQILNNKMLEKTGNFHVTWFGKMKEARKNGILIKSRWRHKNDREIIVNRIDQ